MGRVLFSVNLPTDTEIIRQAAAYVSKDIANSDWSTSKDSSLAGFYLLFPTYVEEGFSYKKGDPFTYDGKYYRASQDITTSSAYKPGDPGTESLFYEIKIASNGVIIWQQPMGEFDSPDKGDERWYPDENGSIYVSLIDNNAWSPEDYPEGWQKI